MVKKSKVQTLAFRKGIFLSAAPSTLKGIVAFSLILFSFIVVGQPVKKPFVKASTYPEKSQVKYAKGFNIAYFPGYKLVNMVNYYNNQKDTLQYLLVNRNQAIPKGYPNAQVIRIPVRTFVGMSSMHIAMLEFAGAVNSIVGHGSLKYVTSPAVRRNIKAGKVKEVGLDGNMNHELLIAMRPDLVMVMGNPTAKFSRYQTLIGAGVPVLANNEWLESTPLGRMEWVKLVAALTNKEALVNARFARVEQEYLKLVQVAKRAKTKPVIIAGLPFKGTWLVPDADSYHTQFFKDAGATYQWSKQKGTGSLPLSFEAVAPTALKADVWLNQGYVNSKQDILAKDERFAEFRPFKANKIYNHNKKVNDIGANDFWESGGVNPHLVLADLIKILHPHLLPKHQLIYYKQLL
jgi:iron complex transport system substrate-binding protein